MHIVVMLMKLSRRWHCVEEVKFGWLYCFESLSNCAAAAATAIYGCGSGEAMMKSSSNEWECSIYTCSIYVLYYILIHHTIYYVYNALEQLSADFIYMI